MIELLKEIYLSICQESKYRLKLGMFFL